MELREILNAYVKKGKLNFKSLRLSRGRLRHTKRIIFTGSGKAYSSALAGASAFEVLSDVLISVCPAGEFRFSPTVVDSETLLIAVSRTGAEEDIIASIKRVRAIGGRAIVVCANEEATASKCANAVLNPIETGFEAESFTLILLAIFVGSKAGYVTPLYRSVAIRMAEMLSGKIAVTPRHNHSLAELGEELCSAEGLVVCGRGADYAVATELCSTLEIEAYPCLISRLGEACLKNKKVLAVIGSKDFLHDILFYLDIARQKSEGVFILTTEEVAEELPDLSGMVALSGSLPIFNPVVFSTALRNIDLQSKSIFS